MRPKFIALLGQSHNLGALILNNWSGHHIYIRIYFTI